MVNNQFRNDELCKVNGKDYPVVGGRLRLAHEANTKGLNIETTVIKYENDIAVIQAKVTTETGVYNGLGNATTTRDAKLKNAILELAETRAIARALRFAGYGVEYTGFEEVDYEPEPKADKPPYKPPTDKKPSEGKCKCEKCDENISDKVNTFSKNKFGKSLCMECQKAEPHV
jgi:hypothetical protein